MLGHVGEVCNGRAANASMLASDGEADPDWEFLEQLLESRLGFMQQNLANMQYQHEKREQILDELAETGMTAMQASVESSSGKLM